MLAIGAATVAAVLLILYVWEIPPFQSPVELTEDAYVRGSVTIVAPKVDGYVTSVNVQDFVKVKKGDVLIQLDDKNYLQKLEVAKGNLAVQLASLANLPQTRLVRQAALNSASAQVVSATAQVANTKAQLARAQADMQRAEALVGNESLSVRERDQTVAALRQAEATARQADAAVLVTHAARASAEQDLRSVEVTRASLVGAVEAAKAAVKLAEIDVENTRVLAPRDGQIGEVGVKLGQYVTPGTQLLAVVPSQVWVVANYKEAQTAHMAPGQPAQMKVDGLAYATLRGTVERISPATGSEFSVIKPDNATGNFTKIPQRLLVRIALDPDQPLVERLRPGMSVITRVDTSKSSQQTAAK